MKNRKSNFNEGTGSSQQQQNYLKEANNKLAGANSDSKGTATSKDD
jgi:hypothetical protein